MIYMVRVSVSVRVKVRVRVMIVTIYIPLYLFDNIISFPVLKFLFKHITIILVSLIPSTQW